MLLQLIFAIASLASPHHRAPVDPDHVTPLGPHNWEEADILQAEECGVQAIHPNTIFHPLPGRSAGADIPSSWPWQVSLRSKGRHWCGGLLTSDRWIITAAHCTDGIISAEIHLGAWQVREVVYVVSYPERRRNNTRYSMTDGISLLKLNASVTFDQFVRPACFPYRRWTAKPGWHCYATGWGTSTGSGGAGALMQMEQVVKSGRECGTDQQTQICAEKPQDAPCLDVRGGPLQCKVGGKWYVFGVATTTNSTSGRCTDPGEKRVYATLAEKLEWITKTIHENS